MWNMVLEESSMDTLNSQKDKQVGPRTNWAWNISGGKNDKTEAVLLPAHHEKAGFFGKKTIKLEKIEDSQNRDDQMWEGSTPMKKP